MHANTYNVLIGICTVVSQVLPRRPRRAIDDSNHVTRTAATQGSRQATPIGATSYVDRPTCLFIQIELCQKDTLKEWLRNNVQNRERKVVFKYFVQVLRQHADERTAHVYCGFEYLPRS